MRATGALSCPLRLCMATTFTAVVLVLSICLLSYVTSSFSVTITSTTANVNASHVNNTWLNGIVNSVWWSERLENLVPHGFDDNFDARWRDVCRNRTIVGLNLDGSCGLNKKMVFEKEIGGCCRQRNNVDQIQGDIFSFYLARVLGIGHLPSASLVLPRAKNSQWSAVKSELSLSQWRHDRPLVVTHFVSDLEPASIPVPLRESGRRLHPVWADLHNQSESELIDLVQWSDLILFDYLTANLDRVVNNLYNKQWNDEMMNAPAHNLGRVKSTGLLVFLDNESGLVHGYRLLHKYEMYHRALLSSLCVFRKRTVDMIRKLHYHGNAGLVIQSAFQQMEGVMAENLPAFPQQSRKILQQRIEYVFEHVKWCEQQYAVR